MNLLKGKTAIVTGGSRGIGAGIVKAFVEQGANVAFTFYGTAPEEAEAEIQELRDKGAKIAFYQSNAADFAACEELVEKVLADFGGIDILVNNAGITKDNLLMRMSEADFDKVIAVNLKSIFNMTKAVQKVFLKQRSGNIINMSSVVGVQGNAGQANYSASKAGMIALAKSIAQEMGPKGIRANAIAPGFIDTAMTQALDDNIRKEWTSKIPLRRGGTVEDIANTAVYLGSELSSYVTGQVIQVDGGMNM